MPNKRPQPKKQLELKMQDLSLRRPPQKKPNNRPLWKLQLRKQQKWPLKRLLALKKREFLPRKKLFVLPMRQQLWRKQELNKKKRIVLKRSVSPRNKLPSSLLHKPQLMRLSNLIKNAENLKKKLCARPRLKLPR